MGSIGFAATSPGELYAGANSTATSAVAPVYLTAKPADSTRYWVGGTGNWSDTARWSTSSGGASGASVPRSHDDVVFDSASNATAYTATVNAVTGGIRMKSLTIAGPASGNVTLAGSTAIDGIHGNVTLPATGLTRTYTGAITLSGSTSGLTLTTNGVALANNSTLNINGVGSSWSLGSALSGSVFLGIINGDFDTANYNVTIAAISFPETTSTVSFGSSTVSLNNTNPFFHFIGSVAKSLNLTFNAGTSLVNFTGSPITQIWNTPITFYDVAYTSTSASNITSFNAAITYRNLTLAAPTSSGLTNHIFRENATITGTLTCSAGTNATMRHFCRSDTIGTTRTITAAAVSLTDVDFRDVTIAGAAAPATGTRLGDCKGNSGITFTAAANKYWNLAGGGNWSATGWATSSGGSPAVNNFPLAQDTCFFEATGLNSGATITVNAAYNIGTIDMSARTTNTMTLSISGTNTPTIYGNWINGTGTSLSGTARITFSGRGGQTITSAGATFTQPFTINSPNGTVAIQDALTTNVSVSGALDVSFGTFDADTYNITLSGSSATLALASTASSRTLDIGSGTLLVAGSGIVVSATASQNLTVTGSGTISLTSASAKTFAGGSVSYTNITLNQGGAGTLTISGNNTFANITNTYKATGATTINFGTTTQTVGNFTAAGEVGRVLTLTGSSASSPCTLVHTGSGTAADVDYLTITGVRAF
jgi:hypothetical protein